VFVNLAVKLEARNIAQRYAMIVFVLKSVTMPPQHLLNFSKPLEMTKAQAFRWHNKFSEGRTLVEFEQRSGRPSSKRTGDNTARVREFFDLIEG
jgi:hypothetical protein